MQILVVAGIVAALGLMDSGPADASWLALAGAAVAYVAVAYAATRWNTHRGLRGLMRGNGEGARWDSLVTVATRVYLVAGMAALMFAGWGARLMHAPVLARLPLAAEALAAAPFMLALIAHWLASYPYDRAVRMRHIEQMAMAGESVMPSWTRREYLSFQIRHQLLFIVIPAGIIIFILRTLELLGPRIGPTAMMILAVAKVSVIFVLAPALLVRIWRTRPMPAGALLDRLEELCRRMKLGYRRILLWETGGVIVNAGVIGMIRPVRYVLLSDALLARFDDDAVDAIFAHEAGHVVHKHIPYMLAFTAGLVLVCQFGGELIVRALDPLDRDWRPLLLAVTAGLWGWLFGMLSRRFERQADVFAAAAIGGGASGEITPEGAAVFGSALMTVARLNGVAPTQRNFRHGPISSRVNYVTELAASGRGVECVNRAIARIKLVIWAILAAGIALAAVVVALGPAGQ